MPDYSKMSDAELSALVQPQAAPASNSAPGNYGQMSDADLMKAIQPQQRGVADQLLGLTGPRYQTWPERAVREMASIPEKTMTAAASAPPGSRELTENLVPATTEAAAAFGPMVPKVVASLGRSALPTSQELKSAAGSGYDAARNLTLDIKPASVTNSMGVLRANLEKDGINAELAPKTFSILSKAGEAPADSVVTVGNLDTLRRSLGHAAGDFTNKTEQLAARRAIEHLDTYLSDIPAGDVLRGDASQVSRILGEARANYAAGKRSEQVGNAVEAADLSAAAANSGRNIGNAERQKFKSLLLSDKQSAGFSPEELAQVERLVRGTATGNSLRHIGNFLGGGGGLGQSLTAGAGAVIGGMAAGPVGAGAGAVGLPIVGNVARAASNASTQRQARLLDEMVRSRSPEAEARAAEPVPPNRIPPAILARMLLQSQPQQ